MFSLMTFTSLAAVVLPWLEVAANISIPQNEGPVRETWTKTLYYTPWQLKCMVFELPIQKRTNAICTGAFLCPYL